MNDHDIQNVLDKAAISMTLPENFQQPSAVVRETAVRRGRDRRRYLYGVGALVAAAAALCLTIAPGVVGPAHAPHSGPAQVIPSISGTVTDIKDGHLELTDVTDSLRPVNPPLQAFRVPVPSGRWISANHWQSDGDTLDVFRGQSVVYFTEHPQWRRRQRTTGTWGVQVPGRTLHPR